MTKAQIEVIFSLLIILTIVSIVYTFRQTVIKKDFTQVEVAE